MTKKRQGFHNSYLEVIGDRCIVKNKNGDQTCFLTKQEAERLGLIKRKKT